MTGSIPAGFRVICLNWNSRGADSAAVQGKEARAAESVWLPPPSGLVLAEGEIHVWRVSLTRTLPSMAQLRQVLSADELARAKRFRFQSDRDRFVACRGTLRRILARYLSVSPGQVGFCYSQHGRPSLDRVHEHSCGIEAVLDFSLAHSGHLALIAVSSGRRVGVDLERLRSDLSLDTIAQSFSQREQDELRGLPAHERHLGFFRCWTRKEAYLKARGEGLVMPLDRFTVSLIPGDPSRLVHVEGEPEEPSRWALVDLAPGAGYVAALAIQHRFDGEVK
jgi:4'-phosphopantetheinyl transferase